jgi:2-oxo-4-hydroxy-4-carboxy--5-ureidoimidazoline (OHCU) decarboxylase
MSPPSLPPATSLNKIGDDAILKNILDLLFEPSPILHDLALPMLHRRFWHSYTDVIDAIYDSLTILIEDSATASDRAELDAVLGSHPRLGAKKVESEQSRAEQAQLQQQDGAAAEAEAKMLSDLNDEYERKFPGLRYVVFVNGRGRPEIMDDMRSRIARGDADAERLAAIGVGREPFARVHCILCNTPALLSLHWREIC